MARTIPLSKEVSPYPAVGNIRTIAVLSPLLKVYEKVILKRLTKHIVLTNALHPAQTGFTSGKSTVDNIDKLGKLLQKGANSD